VTKDARYSVLSIIIIIIFRPIHQLNRNIKLHGLVNNISDTDRLSESN